MPENSRTLLVYDGDCEFCRFWIDDWRTRTGARVQYVTSQEIAATFPDVPREKYAKSVQLIDEDGSRHEGAAAVFRLLSKRVGGGWWLRLYEAPAVAPISEWAYRWIARHRTLCLKIARLLWGSRIEHSRHDLVGRVFLQALSAVYFIAFISLLPQLPGLVGEHGLLPIGTFLEALKARYGGAAFWLAPTLAWFGAHAGALQFMALLGAGAALLSFGGMFVAPCFLLMWILYLSLTIAGQDFTAFQGDALLLEAGFLAIFLVPFRRTNKYRSRVEASSLVVWLYRFLAFRLTFSSGVAKLLSGDPSWRNLNALAEYFETQPLPTAAAWYAHQLPSFLLKCATFVSLGVELLVPFLFLMPRRARALGAAITIVFQLTLIATGNFGLLNWLTIALCLPLLDDALLERLWPRFKRHGDFLVAPISRLRQRALKALSVIVLTLGLTHLLLVFTRVPSPLLALVAAAAPFRVSNDYGLFSVMPTTRQEIVIEGSRDGLVWKEYAFKQKLGDVKHRPGLTAPFQPRLDWEMRFASIGGPDAHPWVAHLMIRLLQGAKPVQTLLASNPFPDALPTYVRATLYSYRFTTAEERGRDGAWWRREMKATYLPPLTLVGESF